MNLNRNMGYRINASLDTYNSVAPFPLNSDRSLSLYRSNLESQLCDDQSDKPLSAIYRALLPSVHFGMEAKRLIDYPDLDAEDWEDIWEYPFSQLAAVKDHLIQFKLVHRAYLTPQRLNQIYPGAYPHCWKCGGGIADFQHMLWSCPKLQSFWGEAVHFITFLLTIPIPMTFSVCLMGLVSSLVHHRPTKTLIGVLLF